MKRDSNVWWWVMAGAVFTAVSSRMDLLDHLLPAAHTDKVHALIELISLVIGIVAGKLATSPLPISEEGRERYLNGNGHGKVDPRKLPILLLALVLTSSACALASAPPPATQPPPAGVGVHNELVKAVDWAATAVDVARTAQRVEIEAYRNGRLSDAQHRVVQTAFNEFFGAAIDVLTTAQDLNKSDLSRWAAAQAVGGLASTLIDQIDQHLPPAVRPYLDSLKAILQLLGVGPTPPGEGGFRG